MKRPDREQPGSLAAHLGMREAELDALLDDLGEEFGDFTEPLAPPAVVDLEAHRRERQARGKGERV